MFDPAQAHLTEFIPAKEKVCEKTAYPTPYELAWQESHSGKGLSDTIETVMSKLGVSYDMASSLVWPLRYASIILLIDCAPKRSSR